MDFNALLAATYFSRFHNNSWRVANYASLGDGTATSFRASCTLDGLHGSSVAAVFVEGIIFIIMSFLRSGAIIDSIR